MCVCEFTHVLSLGMCTFSAKLFGGCSRAGYAFFLRAGELVWFQPVKRSRWCQQQVHQNRVSVKGGQQGSRVSIGV